MSLLDRFDFLSPEVVSNPYPYYAEMRERAPLMWNERLGVFAVSRYEDVAFVLKNAALFSSANIRVAGSPVSVVSPDKTEVPSLLNSDPPVHTRLRTLVSRAFTPKHISALEPRVRALSRELRLPVGRPARVRLRGGARLAPAHHHHRGDARHRARAPP